MEDFMDVVDIMLYVNNEINKGSFILLPNTIANGNVYKVNMCGDLNNDGFELSYLYIPKGSSILLHEHTTDVERYKLIMGNLSVGGNFCNTNVCLLGNVHNIDEVLCDTIIESCKVSVDYLKSTSILFDSNFFDTFIQQKLLKENSFKCNTYIKK